MNTLEKLPVDSVICLRPFYSLELNLRGDVSVCCPAWARGMIGNIKKKSILEIWNDRPARDMRRMMLEGQWQKICRPTCPVILNYCHTKKKTNLSGPKPSAVTEEILAEVKAGMVELGAKPTWINFANSRICNLNCVMCAGSCFKEDKILADRAMEEVKSFLPEVRELYLTGHGDPFARQDTRNLLLNLDSSLYPELKINLLTNGLLLPGYWQKIKDLNFGFINISVDAATKKTYEHVRKNGTWEQLIRAFEVVQANRNKFEATYINMTVMRSNFREIPAFVELASRYGFGAGISKVRGRWKDENIFTSSADALFEELAVLIKAAAEKAKALNVPFDYGTFMDILDGKYPTMAQRNQQKISDTLKSIFYKTKSFKRE